MSAAYRQNSTGPLTRYDRFDIAGATREGAAWLASAGTHPRSTLAFWESRPGAPVVLPCGTAFDVVNVPSMFGRRMLDALWEDGPGSGPVAAHRGRMLLFTAPGTAHRLPSLLEWEEWGPAVPPLLCHGTGDAVTVPPLLPGVPTTPGTPRRLTLGGRPGHPPPLVAGTRGHALGLRPGGPRERQTCGADIDFSWPGSGC